MPAAHRDPWMHSSVGLMYLANGFAHVSYTQWRHSADSIYVVVTMYRASMYVKER